MSWLASRRASSDAEVELLFKTRRRGRLVGVGAAAGAVLAFGMTPPTAHADDFGLGDLIGDLIASTSSAASSAGELSTPAVDQALSAAAPTLSAADIFQQYIYDPAHTAVEAWINSSFGEQVDSFKIGRAHV